MSWELRWFTDQNHLKHAQTVQSRDAHGALRASTVGRLVFDSTTFNLFCRAYDRLLQHLSALSGSNLMGPAEPLTPQAYADVQLDLHALLGMVRVLIDGEKSQWPLRVRGGREFAKRFGDLSEEEIGRNPELDFLFHGLRNYAQHHSHIPFALSQGQYAEGTVIFSQLHIQTDRLSAYNWEPRHLEFLDTTAGRNLRSIVMDSYHGLDTVDSLNRELALEAFVSHREAAYRIAEEAVTHQGTCVLVDVRQSSSRGKRICRPLEQADLLLLDNLASLPAEHPILFPRPPGLPSGIRRAPASNRPLLQERSLPLDSNGIANWALDLARARQWINTGMSAPPPWPSRP